MSKSASATPSSATTRPPSIATAGFGSCGLRNAAKPFSASSTANLSSRSGRSSQSAKRRQRFAPITLLPSGRPSPWTAVSAGDCTPSRARSTAGGCEAAATGLKKLWRTPARNTTLTPAKLTMTVGACSLFHIHRMLGVVTFGSPWSATPGNPKSCSVERLDAALPRSRVPAPAIAARRDDACASGRRPPEESPRQPAARP